MFLSVPVCKKLEFVSGTVGVLGILQWRGRRDGSRNFSKRGSSGVSGNWKPPSRFRGP